MWANRLGKTDVPIEQITEEAKKAGQWGFWKVPAEVAGPADTIPFPKRVTYFDYEGEVAIVIGKRGKNIPASKDERICLGCHSYSTTGRFATAAAPIVWSAIICRRISTAPHPWVRASSSAKPTNKRSTAETRVNGVVRQSYSTKEMIWNFGEVLEYLSQDFTFVPGDVIAGGTSAGTAADKSRRSPDGKRPLDLFLKIGDVVEVSSSKIGALSNKIVASD